MRNFPPQMIGNVSRAGTEATRHWRLFGATGTG